MGRWFFAHKKTDPPERIGLNLELEVALLDRLDPTGSAFGINLDRSDAT
jgi:hypothetical protein